MNVDTYNDFDSYSETIWRKKVVEEAWANQLAQNDFSSESREIIVT
jgi:hypothetical protein